MTFKNAISSLVLIGTVCANKMYEVTMNSNVDPEALLASFLPNKRLGENSPATIHKLNIWESETFHGYHHARVSINEETARKLEAHPDVRGLEASDTTIQLPEIDFDPNHPMDVPDPIEFDIGLSNDVPWGLDRIDQESAQLDNNPFRPDFIGRGVDIYVLDTGVQSTHKEFKEGIAKGKNFATVDEEFLQLHKEVYKNHNAGKDGEYNGGVDCNGHGTHVASTAAGKMYGVARGATIIPVRVMNCYGSGSLFGLSNGIDWAIKQAKSSGRKSIISMSLLAGYSISINNKVKEALSNGVAVVVAAGNYNRDAKMYSPSSVKEALTVGALAEGDIRASYSNWGANVDVFAPGSKILAAWIGSDTSTRYLYGTSMATPMASGALAAIWEKNSKLTHLEAMEYLKNASVKNQVKNACAGSNNAIIQTVKASQPKDPKDLLDIPDIPDAPWMLDVADSSKISNWLPQFEISSEEFQAEGYCVTFKASLLNTASKKDKGFQLVLASSHPARELEFLNDHGSCSSPASKWYFIQATNGDKVQIRKSDRSEEQGKKFEFKDGNYWVRASKVSNGRVMRVEFGYDDPKPKNALLSFDDEYNPISEIRRMAFGAIGGVVRFGDIQHCSETAGPPTPSPTIDETSFEAPKSLSPVFTEFRDSWTSTNAGRMCFSFSAAAEKEFGILLAKGDEPTTLKKRKDQYSVYVTTKSTQIIRKKKKVMKAGIIPAVQALANEPVKHYRVELFNNGLLQISCEGNLIAQFKDDSKLAAKYISFVGGKRTLAQFSGITDCVDENASPLSPPECSIFTTKSSCKPWGCKYKNKICSAP